MPASRGQAGTALSRPRRIALRRQDEIGCSGSRTLLAHRRVIACQRRRGSQPWRVHPHAQCEPAHSAGTPKGIVGLRRTDVALSDDDREMRLETSRHPASCGEIAGAYADAAREPHWGALCDNAAMSEAWKRRWGSGGVVETFSQSRGMGSIRLDDGRLVPFSRSSVSTHGQPNVGRTVQVSLAARAGRLLATDVRFETASSSDAPPGPGTRGQRRSPKPVSAASIAAVRNAATRNPSATDPLRALTSELTREIKILLVGGTGMGKSTTVNELLGAECAPVGHFEPETRSVITYRAPLGQATVAITDTPGLCDDHVDRGNDETYVAMMAEQASPVDLMFFVTRLDENRVTQDEIRSLELITARFGREVWRRAIIVMTHADHIAPEDFSSRVAGRGAAIARRIAPVLPSDVASVPMIPVANNRATTPDGRRWLAALWIASAERIRAERYLAYHFATADRVVADRPRRRRTRRGGTKSRDGTPDASPPARARGSAAASATDRGAPAAVRTISGESSEPRSNEPGLTPAHQESSQAREIAALANKVNELVAQNLRDNGLAGPRASRSQQPARTSDITSPTQVEVLPPEASPGANVIDAAASSRVLSSLGIRSVATGAKDGVSITTVDVAQPKPIANNSIVVDRQEASVINNIYHARASALGEVATRALAWVVGKVRKALLGA